MCTHQLLILKLCPSMFLYDLKKFSCTLRFIQHLSSYKEYIFCAFLYRKYLLYRWKKESTWAKCYSIYFVDTQWQKAQSVIKTRMSTEKIYTQNLLDATEKPCPFNLLLKYYKGQNGGLEKYVFVNSVQLCSWELRMTSMASLIPR